MTKRVIEEIDIFGLDAVDPESSYGMVLVQGRNPRNNKPKLLLGIILLLRDDQSSTPVLLFIWRGTILTMGNGKWEMTAWSPLYEITPGWFSHPSIMGILKKNTNFWFVPCDVDFAMANILLDSKNNAKISMFPLIPNPTIWQIESWVNN